MSSFATLDDVIALSGKEYTEDEEDRIEELLPLVSDLICYEADKVGKDIYDMMEKDANYSSVVKLVTCDVVARILRQDPNQEPMSQESQSALGYSWSGTYAIPGGGAALALMNNELKRLGLLRQRYGSIDLWQR